MKKRWLSTFLALVMAVGLVPTVANAISTDNAVILSIPTDLISQCGSQSSSSESVASKACQAFTFAYSDIILDQASHSWTSYLANKNSPNAVTPSNYTWGKISTIQDILKFTYDSINAGRPVILGVYGSSNWHYVVAVGYYKNCDINNFAQQDFIVLDPWNGQLKSLYSKFATKAPALGLRPVPTGENSGKYSYVCRNSGSTAVLGLCAHSYHTVQQSSGTYTAVCKNCGEEYILPSLDASTAGEYKITGTNTLCTAPYQDSKTTTRLNTGDTVNIAGSTTNAYGNLWYKTTDGKWIYSSYLTFVKGTTPTISGETKPTGNLKKGEVFSLRGIISSTTPLTNVSAYIYNSSGSAVMSYSENWGKTSYNIRNDGINSQFTFGTLGDGNYTYVVSATNSAGTKELIRSSFIVGAGSKQYYTITFDPMGGTVSPITKQYVMDERIEDLPTPVRPGYEFGGWTPNKIQTGVSSRMIVSYGAAPLNQDTTLYATWDTPVPGQPTLSLEKTSYQPYENVVFTWNATSNATIYLLYLDCDNPSGARGRYGSTDTRISLTFSPEQAGNYTAYLTAYNDDKSTQSNTITFKITEPVHTHILTHTPAKAATEEREGNIEYWYCSDCGKYFSDSAATKEITQAQTVIAKLEHTHQLTLVSAKAATCTESGNLEYWYCETCGKYFSDVAGTGETTLADVALESPGHNYVNGVCTRCGASDPNPSDVWDDPHFPKQTIYFQDQFTDIPANQWFTDSVAEAYELGLMKGNSANTFNPYGDVTLAEAITMAARIHSIYTTGTESFVQTGTWYQVYLDYAYNNGIISRAYYNADVTRKATRAQFAEIFANALPSKALRPINSISDGTIPDVPMSESYAPYAYKLYRAGILTGGDANGTFSPGTYITRAEAAAIVSRMAEANNRVTFSLR